MYIGSSVPAPTKRSMWQNQAVYLNPVDLGQSLCDQSNI